MMQLNLERIITVTLKRLKPMQIAFFRKRVVKLHDLLQEADAYRDRVIANSEGEAKRFLKLLAEYEKAPEVTRERLYIEAVESVYTNSNKVMMDVEGGNNLLYLPLDQIMKQRSMINPQSSSNNTFTSDKFGLSNQQPSHYR